MPGADDTSRRGHEGVRDARASLIAARERLRGLGGRERELLEGILLHSPHGIIVCDAQGRLLMQNAAADRIWAGSAPAASVPEWSQYRAFHPDGRPFEVGDWSMARCLSERKTTEAEELHIQRFDGTRGVLLGSSAPIEDDDGELVGAMAIFADISRFKLIETASEAAHRRATFLAGAGTALLSSSRDIDDTLARLTQVAVPDIADWCVIEIPEEGIVHHAHVDPEIVAFAREMRSRYPSRPDAPRGVLQVLRSGRAELYSEVPDSLLVESAVDDEHLRMARAIGMQSVMIVPMMVRGRAFGAITLVSTQPTRRYDTADLAMAERLAQKTALAVENARLFRAEQHARAAIERATDRVVRLQAITSDLAKALGSDSVAQVVIDHSSAAIGAVTAAIWQVMPDGKHVSMMRSWNYPTSERDRYERVEIDGPAPVADAVRRGAAVFIDSGHDYESQFPDSFARLRHAGVGTPGSMACLPLEVGSRVLGVLAFVFPDQRVLDADERAFLSLVAGHFAQGLYRARVYEAEQRARSEMALLYELVDEVSRAATLDEVYETALSSIERALGVQRSSILLFDDDGVIRFKAWHGLSDTYRAAVEGHSPWSRDTSDAAPIVVSDVARDESHAAYVSTFKAEDIAALAFVPLAHGQRLLGKFMVYSAEPRVFSDDEIRTARTMATQVAHAVVRKLADAEIARLYTEAQAARAEAETASRLKDEFLAVVSHELRTPLSVILGWSAVLRTPRRDDAATLTKGVDVIERNARAQMKIIEDILDVSRVITGKLVIDPRPVSLSGLIVEALEVVKASAQAKEIAIAFAVEHEDKYVIVGDPERLRQVMWNLLSNAVKFTPRGGEIDVALRREQTSIAIEVSDTGPGIAPEFLPHVFERFRQADSSTTRSQGGLGLGLAIVRHLVELHGGQVQVDSAGIGQGAKFTVRLPVRALSVASDRNADATGRFVAHHSARPTAPQHEAAAQLSGVRVLIVDDERDARELLHEVLVLRGATVRSAASAASAFAALSEFHPHVLVSDIGMPEEDGYSLIRRVRRGAPAERNVAAIALTAYARSEERKRALDAGYDEHLSKPADANALAKLIASLSQTMRH